MINFKRIMTQMSEEDYKTLLLITERAVQELEYICESDKTDLLMSLSACHGGCCPLRLKDLLEADKLNFAHDVCQIHGYLDTTTGELTNCFFPRYAKIKINS